MSELTKVFPLISRSKDTTVIQPKELIAYKVDENGNQELDNPQFRYYYLPDSDVEAGVDLQAGFSNFESPSVNTGLKYLLQAIQRYEEKQGSKVIGDVITWRGIMKSVFTLPFINLEKVSLDVICFDGQIFIDFDEEIVAAKKQDELTIDPYHKKMIYSGYKFEAMSTLPKPWAQCTRKEIESRSKAPISKEQTCTVVKTGFGKIKLVLGAEVDCVWNSRPESGNATSSYMELKTTSIIDNHKSYYSFERKLLGTWAQCFLVGIPKIVYGYRDQNLIVRSVETFKTEEVPILLKKDHFPNQPNGNSAPAKKPNKCMDTLKFFTGFLTWLNENIPRDDETSAWRITFDPSTNKNYVNLKKLEDGAAQKLHSSENGMLTKEFKEWRESLKNKK